jgi:hypothetical protein
MATGKEFKDIRTSGRWQGVIAARSGSLIIGISHRLADFAALCPIR